MRNIDFTGLAYLAGGALVVYVLYRAWQGVKAGAPAFSAVAAAINPASPDNLAYRAASAGTAAGSLGSALYDFLNPDANALIQASTDAALALRAAPSMALADELYAQSILSAAPGVNAAGDFVIDPFSYSP